MLSLLSALLYAYLSGRQLVVDWSDLMYSDDRSNTFDRLFDGTHFTPLDRLPDTDSIRPSLWRGHLHDDVGALHRHLASPRLLASDAWRFTSVDLSRLDYDEDVVVMWTVIEQIYRLRRHLTGPWQPWRRAPTKAILRTLSQALHLQPDLQQRVDRFKRDHFNTPMVGVHIRYSDKQVAFQPMLKRLERLLQEKKELTVFLATDNADVKEEVMHRFRNVVSTEKWYPPPHTPMHLIDSGCPNRLAHARDALVDLYLLAACEYLIVDERSSFAYLATILGKTPPHAIFNFQRSRFLPPALRRTLWLYHQRLKG